jgi:hypothetical protein
VTERGAHRNAGEGDHHRPQHRPPPGAQLDLLALVRDLELTTIAALHDFDAWARALGKDPGSDLRWSTDDLVEFFVAAWETATELLPRLALDDPTTRGRWSAVPKVELWVGADYQHHQSGAQPMLTDVLDLTSFGPSGHRGQRSELFVSLSSVPGLDEQSRRNRARLALVDMAHRYGFIQVRESTF